MPLNQHDHGDEDWGRLSEGWPATTDMAYAKWVFANKSNNLIPYGSYVLIDSHTVRPCLRVETQGMLDKLNSHFDIVHAAILTNIF